MAGSGLWVLRVYANQAFVPAIDEALEPFANSVASFEIDEGTTWRIEAYCADRPDLDAINRALGAVSMAFHVDPFRFDIMPLANRDWVAESLKSFPPLIVGRLFIFGSHITDVPPPSSLPLKLGAGAAFGAGDHATTRGCLTMLMDLSKRLKPKRILDMGTGSGILAMAAARFWSSASVLATDIDPVSVRVAKANVKNNRLGLAITVTETCGFLSPQIRKGAPYDLIVANILARPLVNMARDMRRSAKAGTRLILSGLLIRDACLVLSVYRAMGFRLVRKCDIGNWRTMELILP